ncbi:MFS transporter [Saccharopolyspora sp. TS4A08]|uniref:MFS transporter n=1 Tax=Saccharopolyspora ipomoeae TaxID=3042027 RepID=A0ABT6PT28_9PSEU|nr:MFS transporter [Saccharopolyspora sp. TS4A08]MDI2030581.1 MFS transporter [Saccharopolyspora sp. TS4A08]
MSPWRVALVVQATCGQAFWLGIRVVVGYRALEAGGGPEFLGLLATAFAAPALVASIPVGKVTDRLGGAGVTAVGLLLSGTGAIVALSDDGLAMLLAGALIMGLGQQLLMVGQQTFIAHVGAGSDAAFGTLTAASSIGQMIGPPVVTAVLAVENGLASGTEGGLVACLLFLVLALPLTPRLLRTDRALRSQRGSSPGERPGTRKLLRLPGMWRSLVVSGAVLVTLDLLYAFIPVWAVEQGVDPRAVGLLLALRAAVSLITRTGLSRLVNRFGRLPLIATSVLAGAVALGGLPLVGAWGAVPVMVGLGIALGLPQPLTMAWVTSLSPPSSHGAALGLRLTVNRMAQVSLPLLVGAVLGPVGVIGVFWANAALLLGAAGSVIARRRRD